MGETPRARLVGPGALRRALKGEKISHPRVRREHSDGTKSEVKLASYEAAKGYEKNKIRDAIIRAHTHGVSTNEVQDTIDWTKGATSASEVSRVWAHEGARLLAEPRERDLTTQTWVALMLDGIRLSGELTAVVALGFTASGQKVILDLEIGASENETVCRGLVVADH